MRYILCSLFIISTACATPSRNPAAVAPPGTLPLEQALAQGLKPTLEYLKPLTPVAGYIKGSPRDPAAAVPRALRAERGPKAPKEKQEQQKFFRRFRNWSMAKKTERARQLTSEFECSKALEAQSLGFSLELDFPEDEATIASEALHEKVLHCATFPRHESLFRLAIFAIQKNNCTKANEYLDLFPPTPERGLIDRLAYIKGLCSGDNSVTERNPWGGYGIRLTQKKGFEPQIPAWYLAGTSGSVEWDRLLKTFIDLSERGDTNAIQHIASKINYEKFRLLPLPFQTSMLTLMSFAGADLSVFQALHHYLADHPDMAAPSVENLLFPKRYWKEIVENSKDTNPVLVKALIRQESAFNPTARSRARAAGLMQLIYPTAHRYGVANRKQWLQPEANIRAGSKFLGQLINEFGSVELALAAYNAGPGMVRQWQKRYPTKNMDLFVEMIPFSETREYVRLVNRNYRIYEALLQSPEVTKTAKTAPTAEATAGPTAPAPAVVAVSEVVIPTEAPSRGPASIVDVVIRRPVAKQCSQERNLPVSRGADMLCTGVW